MNKFIEAYEQANKIKFPFCPFCKHKMEPRQIENSVGYDHIYWECNCEFKDIPKKVKEQFDIY